MEKTLTETFYRRNTSHSGRNRYIPVLWYDEEVTKSFPPGNHLVTVSPGNIKRRHVEPEIAPYLALPERSLDDITDLILEALRLEPPHTLITEEQKEAWEALSSALGQEAILFRPSAFELASKIVELLALKARELV